MATHPRDARAVPAMIVDRTLLVGSYDIPTRLPTLIEAGLAQGGIDWPAIPGLETALAQMEASESQTTAITTSPSPAPDQGPAKVSTIADPENPLTAGLQRDPIGHGVALALLAVMALSLILIVAMMLRSQAFLRPVLGWQAWLVPILAAVGLGIASYLASVETTSAAAVCGPVGDCNAVQQSAYARLFGAIPIGVLGIWAMGPSSSSGSGSASAPALNLLRSGSYGAPSSLASFSASISPSWSHS